MISLFVYVILFRWRRREKEQKNIIFVLIFRAVCIWAGKSFSSTSNYHRFSSHSRCLQNQQCNKNVISLVNQSHAPFKNIFFSFSPLRAIWRTAAHIFIFQDFRWSSFFFLLCEFTLKLLKVFNRITQRDWLLIASTYEHSENLNFVNFLQNNLPVQISK